MHIQVILKYGCGNVLEALPACSNMIDAYGEENVDLFYMPIYPTDSIEKTRLFPWPVREITPEQERKSRVEYDYKINYPDGFTATPDGEYIKEPTDMILEGDSEVRRNLMVCKFLGISDKVNRPLNIKTEKGEEWDDRPYVILHNGGLNLPEWRKKKYPMFPRLADLIKREYGLECASIGIKEEYIQGTVDLTGKTWEETAAYIKNSHFYVGTDTASYHIAGALGVKGFCIFTCTSLTKNWDKDFHGSIMPITSDATCYPGQWGYHWHPECVQCSASVLFYPCQNIAPSKIMSVISKNYKPPV